MLIVHPGFDWCCRRLVHSVCPEPRVDRRFVDHITTVTSLLLLFPQEYRFHRKENKTKLINRSTFSDWSVSQFKHRVFIIVLKKVLKCISGLISGVWTWRVPLESPEIRDMNMKTSQTMSRTPKEIQKNK